MAYRNNNAEGGAVGTTAASAQSGSGDAFDNTSIVNGGSVIYSTDYYMHGAQSYNVTTTATTGDLGYLEYTGANNASASGRFYLYMSGRPSGAVVIASIRNASTGVCSIVITSSFRLQFQDTVGTNIGTIVSPLSSGVWYRVEFTVTVATSTTGSGSFAYYTGDSSTGVETPMTFTGSNFGTANITGVRYGKVTNTNASTNFYFDDLAFDDGNTALIGGFSPSVSAPWLGT